MNTYRFNGRKKNHQVESSYTN